jgi:NRAMP (natural resistance-associated macrophage protein)-like metal ion transporter
MAIPTDETRASPSAPPDGADDLARNETVPRSASDPETAGRLPDRLKKMLQAYGPGVITGAADDDPSGIATYAQTGAQFGYGQLWTAVYMLPLQTAVQEACARIGAVTGRGISSVVRQHYGKAVLYTMAVLVLVANTINIGADLGAMAAAADLLVPIPFGIATLLFAVSILLLEIFSSYQAYARILKWLALSLLAYPVTAVIMSEPWDELLRATFIPHIELTFAFLFIITGVLGTTISPYMFFWEASEEVEEEESHGVSKVNGRPAIGRAYLAGLVGDNLVGMLVSAIATWSIIVVGATALHNNGQTHVDTAADVALALEPLVQGFPNAGTLAKLIFAGGILGLGFLSVPVLSGSAAYAFSEAFNWPEGLARTLKEAPGFYGVIAVATIAGLALNYVGINPIQALVYTAVINGLVAAPLLFLIARIAERRDIMGDFASGRLSRALVWLTFASLAAAAIAMVATIGRS